MLVSETGAPLEVRVAQGARAGLSEAAVAAVRQWRFEPGSKNGAPVRTWTRVQIPFEAIPFATPPPGATSPPAPTTAPPLERRVPPSTATAAPPTPAPPRASPSPTAAPAQSERSGAALLSTIPPPWSPEPPAAIPEGAPDAVYRTRRSASFAITPGQARLFVDGAFVGIAEDWSVATGGTAFELGRRGPHHVYAELPGYRTLSIEIDVTPAAEQLTVEVAEQMALRSRVAYTRLPQPDAQTRGSVELRIEPGDAFVSINGRDFGSAAALSAAGPLRLPGPAVHELTFSAPGRRTRQARVLVSSSAPSDVAVLRILLR